MAACIMNPCIHIDIDAEIRHGFSSKLKVKAQLERLTIILVKCTLSMWYYFLQKKEQIVIAVS